MTTREYPRSTPTAPRPIGFIDYDRTRAIQTAQPQSSLLESSDAILRFDAGETVGIADLLHVCLVLGTTGSGKTTSVLLPAVNGLIGRGFGGLVVDVKGSMTPAVRAIAARHGRGDDVIEIGPHESSTPVNLLAGATAQDASALFRALFMSHAAGDERNQSFHTSGLAQAVDAWQILSRRCRDTGEPFSLAAFDRLLNEPEFAVGVFAAFRASKNLAPAEQELVRRIAGASAHVIPADAKTCSHRVWREQVTYDMNAVRTGLRLFRASPGLEERFFAAGGAPLDMARWIYDERRIVVLRFSPATGEAGAGIARHALRRYYAAVYARGLGMPKGEATFLCIDEFQDVVSTDPADNLNDASFIAKVREFNCATLLGTQSAVALAQRAHHGLSDVQSILGNCNVRIFMYSDEPETVSLAPAGEAPLDELGPGQAVLVHYDAAARTHRHSTTGVNNMHARLAPVLAGVARSQTLLAVPALDWEETERARQTVLSTVPVQPATDEIIEETSAEAALAMVQSRGADLSHVPEAQRTLPVCLAAVRQDGKALRYVPEALKSAELCLDAVRQNGLALKFVPPRLWTPDLCLEALMQNGMVLEFMPERLKTPEFCLEAVTRDGLALEFVPERLRTEAVCLEAVAQDGTALNAVPAGLRTPEICLAAVQSRGTALEHVPVRLRTRDLCLAAVRSSSWALKFVPAAMKTVDVCYAAARQFPGAASLLPDVLLPASVPAHDPVPAPDPVPAQRPRAGAVARPGGSRLAGSPCRPHRRRPAHTQACARHDAGRIQK